MDRSMNNHTKKGGAQLPGARLDPHSNSLTKSYPHGYTMEADPSPPESPAPLSRKA